MTVSASVIGETKMRDAACRKRALIIDSESQTSGAGLYGGKLLQSVEEWDKTHLPDAATHVDYLAGSRRESRRRGW